LIRWLFLTITICAALPLAIANYYLNTHTEFGSDLSPAETSAELGNTMKAVDGEEAGKMAKNLLNNMLVFTAANIKGNGLWVHIGCEYAVTGLVILFGEFRFFGYTAAFVDDVSRTERKHSWVS